MNSVLRSTRSVSSRASAGLPPCLPPELVQRGDIADLHVSARRLRSVTIGVEPDREHSGGAAARDVGGGAVADHRRLSG